jgi:hypothetical protein
MKISNEILRWNKEMEEEMVSLKLVIFLVLLRFLFFVIRGAWAGMGMGKKCLERLLTNPVE